MRAHWGSPRLGPGCTRCPSMSRPPILLTVGLCCGRAAPTRSLPAPGALPSCGQKERGPLSLRIRLKQFQGRWK